MATCLVYVLSVLPWETRQEPHCADGENEAHVVRSGQAWAHALPLALVCGARRAAGPFP